MSGTPAHANCAIVETKGQEHVGIIVHDTVALSQWYRVTFGAREISRNADDIPIVFLTFGGGSLVEFIPQGEMRDVSEAEKGRVHLCLTVDNVHESLEALRGAGIVVERDVFLAYDDSPVAFIRDPEGHLVQLVTRVKGSSIHAAVFSG